MMDFSNLKNRERIIVLRLRKPGEVCLRVFGRPILPLPTHLVASFCWAWKNGPTRRCTRLITLIPLSS